jgi:hypothetical protein
MSGASFIEVSWVHEYAKSPNSVFFADNATDSDFSLYDTITDALVTTPGDGASNGWSPMTSSDLFSCHHGCQIKIS